jgi:hypothetical protein
MISSIGEYITEYEFIFANVQQEQDEEILKELYDVYNYRALYIADDLSDFCFDDAIVLAKNYKGAKNGFFTETQIKFIASQVVFRLNNKKEKNIINSINKLLE